MLTLPANVPARKNEDWANWAQTAHCRPEYSFYPQHAEDLATIVRFASETGKKLRVVTSGHSWSALVPTDDILVYAGALNKVTMDLSDADQPRVVVECGATVKEVNNVLEQHDCALSFNVVLESVRFGGLVSTGSHGSGWNNPTLSDLVHAIEIVDATGELRRFQTGVDSEEVMNAVRLSLGMFGILYRITLNVQRSWVVRMLDRRLALAEVLPNLKEWVTGQDNMDLFWWPFTDRLWVKSWNRQPEGTAPTARPRYSRIDRVGAAITGQLYHQSFKLVHLMPKLTPLASRAAFLNTPSINNQLVNVMEAIHYRRSIEVVKTGCVEVAFKIDENFDNVRGAMQVVFDRVKAHAARRQYPMNLTMNVRFIRNSNCWLSPAFGEGHTCFIEILSDTDQSVWKKFSGEVAAEWLQLPNAQPHWAKEFRHIPGVIEHIRRECGDRIDRFQQIKARLGLDPQGMFINRSLSEIFG